MVVLSFAVELFTHRGGFEMRVLLNWTGRVVTGLLRRSLLGLAVCGISGVLLVFGGCGSGGDVGTIASPAVQTGMVSGQVTTLVSGVVTPVAGATVSTSAGSATSGGDGSFTVLAPVGDRAVIHVEAAGYAEAFPVARVISGQTTGLGVRLLATGATSVITVSSGGTVTVPNSTAQVTLPADGLVPRNGGAVAGTVTVSVTPINPVVASSLMPGDFTGTSAGGGTAPIESFGALLVDIRDDAGTRYTLAAGRTATIRIPLGTLSPNPPVTTPLWYFDEATGLWNEEGTAILQGTAPNRYYEGTVTRISYWNADQVLDSVVISGCVRDSNNQPVANLLVGTTGINYSGIAMAVTEQDGTFRVAMRRGSLATLSAVEFSLQTYATTPLTNVVTVGPFLVDSTLPNCLVEGPVVLTITTTVLPEGNLGLAYNQTLEATGGIPGYAWSLNPGSNPLPLGLSLNSSGIISGTSTAVGTTTITVRVTDSAGGTATTDLSLSIRQVGALRITTLSPLPAGTVGTAYSLTLAASDGIGALSWSVVSGALPAGITLNPSTGQLSGTPTMQGTSLFTIRVQDSGSPQQADQRVFEVTINSDSDPCPPTCPPGSLTVSNAPASMGGTFNGSITSQSSGGVTWQEVTSSPTFAHTEGFFVILHNLPGLTYQLVFNYSEVGGGTSAGGSWTCTVPAVQGFTTCNGVTINQAIGAITLDNTVLSGVVGAAPPITLNGTLSFTPF